MGAGNQGGSSSAEDGEIRKAFSADPNATAKDARDYFRDRDSGKLAARSYLDSRPTDRTMSDGSPMDDTFAEIIDGRLGNIGVTRNDTSFVNADGESVGSINSAGNFSGNRDVIAALRGTPSLRDMRQAASREAKYGPGSRAAQEGDINTSLLDLVDYAEDGTVQGMGPNRFMDERGRGQLVYDPSAVIPGLPYLQDPQNDVFVPQYDPSRESMAGQALQGVTNYIGDGGMMGAVTRGLGGLSERMSGGVAEDLNPGNFSPMRPVLRPTDGSTTENTGITSDGITSALMGGADSVTKLTNDQLRNLPTYAGGYTGSGANNPFLSADQRGVPNQFNAQGVQVPFDGGNRIDVPLGIGTLPGKKTLSELAKTEPVISAGFSGFNTNMGKPRPFSNTTNQFDPQQRIIDDALAPLGDRVSMYEDDPSIAFGFCGEPFDLSEGAESISSVSPNADMITGRPTFAFQDEFDADQTNRQPPQVVLPQVVLPQVSSFRPTFDVENQQRTGREDSFGRGQSLGYSLPPTSDDRNIVPDRIRETALENQALREKGRILGTGIDLLERDDSGIDEVNSNLYEDRFESEETKMFDFNNDLQKFIAESNGFRPTFDIENQQRANREASFGGADQGVLPSSVSNIVQNPDGSASTGTALPSFPISSGSSDADNILGVEAISAAARAKRLGKLGTATGAENNMPLEQEGPLVERDSRIRDAMAPDGLDDNMYNDGSEIFDLSETYDPSGGGFTGGGGGGSFTGCPEGYEPMTLENGETVCVPIEEEVTEEEVQEVTPYTPAERPAMGPSAYTPQAVSPIRPYTLQPGEQGVGSLADILQLQNYPNIV